MGAKDAGSISVLGLDHLRDEVAMKRQVAYVGPDLMFQPWGRVHKVIGSSAASIRPGIRTTATG